MTPSFRRVYERGKNLRSECRLLWFAQLEDRQGEADADAQRALRNLLKLIYHHCFLPAVQSDETLVTHCIPEVLARNRRIAAERGKSKAAGYSEIQALYREGLPLAELLRQMQRQISRTEQENRELARDKSDYAQRFLCEVYAVAFNSFLDTQYSEYYDPVFSPRKDAAAAEAWRNESGLPRLHTSLTQDADGSLLVLYPVLRLLDGQELSEFQQQMLRCRTSMAKRPGGADPDQTIKMVAAMEELAELVKLTEPIPANAAEAWQNRARDAFEPFMESGMPEYGDFYLQSDSVTPVFRRNMTRLLRAGILDVYGKVLRGQKQATQKDYQTVRAGLEVIQNPDGRNIARVEYVQSELRRRHRDYEKSHSLPQEDYEAYRRMQNRLDNYDHARRNLTFETLYGVCRIHLEMMSRWIGFAQDWERDMYFLLLAWAQQGKLKLTEKQVKSIFEEGKVLMRLIKNLKGPDLTAFLSIYRSGADHKLNFVKVRNKIAHLHLLRSTQWPDAKPESGGSVVEGYLNDLRMLAFPVCFME